MNMKLFGSIGIAIALLFSSPAFALTQAQLQLELAGMHCGGTTCTSVIGTKTVVTPPSGATEITYVNGAPGFIHSLGHFVPSSLIGSEASPGSCIVTTDTLVKTPIYNGPNTSRDKAWSVTSETVSSSESC